MPNCINLNSPCIWRSRIWIIVEDKGQNETTEKAIYMSAIWTANHRTLNLIACSLLSSFTFLFRLLWNLIRIHWLSLHCHNFAETVKVRFKTHLPWKEMKVKARIIKLRWVDAVLYFKLKERSCVIGLILFVFLLAHVILDFHVCIGIDCQKAFVKGLRCLMQMS